MKTVVCIEDEDQILELLSYVLDSPSIKLISNRTASDGIATVYQLQPALVILDIILPDTDGWSVYDAIRSDSAISNTPVVLLTALRREFQPRRNFRETSRDAYINKPFDALQLRNRIEQMLGEKLW